MTRPTREGADLHLHTIFSDGTSTPEELVTGARATGLTVIALTDHDTLDGLDRAHAAAGDEGPEVIGGVEFSCPSRNSGGEEAHLVGLFLDPACAKLQDALARFRRLRRDRAVRMVEKLNRIGVRIRPDDVFNLAGLGNVSRLHIARALVQAGCVRSVDAAFAKWIRVGRPAHVPRDRPAAKATIALIHRAGGVATLAHPGLTNLDEDIPKLVEDGLDAIEVYCTDHTTDQEKHYLETAQRYGLLISGGSDCHGRNKDRSTLGSIRLHADAVAALRERAGRRSAE